MSLNDLPNKWRRIAVEDLRIGPYEGRTLERCADELESALAGGGEAVAYRWAWNDGGKDSWLDTPISPDELAWGESQKGQGRWELAFPRPAGAVQVTELRKVAKRNLRSLINRSNDSEKELMLKCLEELSLKWLCLIGIHKWRSLGSRGLVLPSFIDQCGRCGCGREVMFTGTLTYTPEQMADIAALNPGGSRE